MPTGTTNDRRLVLKDIVIYGSTRSIAGLAVRREVLCVSVFTFYQFFAEKKAPHQVGFRLKLVAMSRQRGTPRRASSGRGKAQHGCSSQTLVDHEPDISPSVRVLVEAWETQVLNQKLSTGEDGSQINHYWMMKNMLCNLAEDMLSNWFEARVVVHTMKSKITEIEAQLMAMLEF